MAYLKIVDALVNMTQELRGQVNTPIVLPQSSEQLQFSQYCGILLKQLMHMRGNFQVN